MEPLRPGLFENPKKFEQAITKMTVVPQTVIVPILIQEKLMKVLTQKETWQMLQTLIHCYLKNLKVLEKRTRAQLSKLS
ncbi:hypothetical protein P7H70_09680 [Vagococcus carniphilus]|uniref:Uncharacterized protein n=1 Tax=Vagococcus carniphilus TaxID=218144 RepID=A0AAW8U802_9ENTE|nr:hypothetical protein [Vagococcus carniphilus]MDT2834330.1 hypothetical protein [Vagococcus carniphilus]